MTPEEPERIPEKLNIAAHFLDRTAAAQPDSTAILGLPAQVSYAELARVVNRAGNALRGSGCAPGDRVLIVLPDSAEFIAAFFGAAKIGAVAVPVNSMTRAGDYSHYLRDSGAKFAVVHAASLEEFLAAVGSNHELRLVVVGASGRGPMGEENRWEEWIGAEDEELEPYPSGASDPAFFLYTSGSGGKPKAAVHRHQDMLVTSRGFSRGVLGIRSDDRTYSVSKLFFAYGLGNGMYFPFSVGAATILDAERPRAERAFEIVARYKPTIFFAVPTFYAALLRELDRGERAEFSSVRLAVSAGERLPPEIFEQFRARLGLEIIDGIGSTEMLHMFLSSRPGRARAGSCGFPVPGYEAKIVDDDGKGVTDGAIGNLWVKGASAFAGYWGQPELTERTKRGDWVITGDKFVRDQEDYYHYCGRADDMMKVAGMWVSPAEVENALLGHPKVAEAAVVGARSSSGLARPVAYVVLRRGERGTAELAHQIREFVRGRLAGYKCPHEVHFLEELPKTATGKIQRYRLRGKESRGGV